MTLTPEVGLQSRIKRFKIRHLLFILIAIIPVIWAGFLSYKAHYEGTEEFKFSIKPSGLISNQSLDHIRKNDHIQELWGIPSDKILNYLFVEKDYEAQPFQIIVKRDNQEIKARLIPRKLEWAFILKTAWAHYFLIITLVTCSLSAVLLAPSEQPTLPFFAAFISSALINANDLTYQFGFADPGLISSTYLTIIVANWLMFSSWAHFSLNFPFGHQLITNRPWAVVALYATPPIITLTIAFSIAGSLSELWFWIHRIRRLFVPLVVIGSYFKIVYDFQTTDSSIVRNQLKYPLVATWFSMGPYLFLYVLPIIMVNHPLIEYRWVVLLSPVFPIAFFMSMIQYRMMDIDKNITNSITYIILVGSFYVLYATSVYLIGNVFWTQNSSWLILIFILVVGLLFVPMKKWITSTINHLFFQE